jgi:hypothetical protein
MVKAQRQKNVQHREIVSRVEPQAKRLSEQMEDLKMTATLLKLSITKPDEWYH